MTGFPRLSGAIVLLNHDERKAACIQGKTDSARQIEPGSDGGWFPAWPVVGQFNQVDTSGVVDDCNVVDDDGLTPDGENLKRLHRHVWSRLDAQCDAISFQQPLGHAAPWKHQY